MTEPILHKRTDRMIPRHAHEKCFMVRFPDRIEWNDQFPCEGKGGLIWYRDGSRTNEGMVAAVYGYGTRWRLGFTLGNAPQYSSHECMPSWPEQWRI
jgi:hypothetical protein